MYDTIYSFNNTSAADVIVTFLKEYLTEVSIAYCNNNCKNNMHNNSVHNNIENFLQESHKKKFK